MKWYWHIEGKWPGDPKPSTLVMVAESEQEVRRVWKHYEILNVRRGAQATRRVKTVE